ncbi:MAG TPA: helix-turn-helix domain-containing protein [Vicinamibacterales bacterium]|jgi:cytoskeleton protein RodZ
MPVIKGPESDFGSRMRQVREQRGVSLRQIAEHTKISVSALEALERNDISRLPGGIFSRAFVRSYAAEIGADPEQTVRDFLSQFPHDSVTAGSPHVLIDEGSRGRRRLDSRAVMILGTLVLVAAAILFWSLKLK